LRAHGPRDRTDGPLQRQHRQTRPDRWRLTVYIEIAARVGERYFFEATNVVAAKASQPTTDLISITSGEQLMNNLLPNNVTVWYRSVGKRLVVADKVRVLADAARH
jgi:hypothetical protein